MASSFVKYKGNGFWINDSILMVTLSYVRKIIEESEDMPKWLIKMKRLIEENSLGYYHGYMHLEFEKYLVNENRKTKFTCILRQTQQYLIIKGEFISIKELNSLNPDDGENLRWSDDMETDRIINILSWIISLIHYRIKIQSGDKINYSF